MHRNLKLLEFPVQRNRVVPLPSGGSPHPCHPVCHTRTAIAFSSCLCGCSCLCLTLPLLLPLSSLFHSHKTTNGMRPDTDCFISWSCRMNVFFSLSFLCHSYLSDSSSQNTWISWISQLSTVCGWFVTVTCLMLLSHFICHISYVVNQNIHITICSNAFAVFVCLIFGPFVA